MDATERLERQGAVFPHERRLQTTVALVAGREAPTTTRMVKCCAAAAGLPAIWSDYHGSRERPQSDSFMTGAHPEMVAAISNESNYEYLDRFSLENDLAQIARQFPRTFLVVPLNDPARAWQMLEQLGELDLQVLCPLSAPSGVLVHRARNPRTAMKSVAPMVALPPITEGPLELVLVAAGMVGYQIMLPNAETDPGRDQETLLFYSLHQPRRVPNLEMSGNLRDLVAEVAAPRERDSFAGKKIFLCAAGGLANPFALAVAWDVHGRDGGGLQLLCCDGDIIAASNRNRQFLFEGRHVGRPKAPVLAEQLGRLATTNATLVGQQRLISDTADLGSLAGYDAVVAAPDNDLARIHCARAATEQGILYFTGATSAVAGYAMAQVPDGPCFECQTGLTSSRSEAQLARARSCQAAEPSVCATNMLVAGLMAAELREAFSGRRPQNLRFLGRTVKGNRLACRAAPTSCRHRERVFEAVS